MHKIYCFNNGGSSGWYQAVAIAEDGTCVAGHTCSHECYMPHDLGITSDWKHDEYDKHYGAGNWELEWVADPSTHGGLQAAFRLNEQLEQKDQEANKTIASEQIP